MDANSQELALSRTDTRCLNEGDHNGTEEKVQIQEMFSSLNHQALLTNQKRKKRETQEASHLSKAHSHSLSLSSILLPSPWPHPASCPTMPSPPSCQSHVPLLPRSCKSQLRNWLGSEGSHGPRAQRPFFPPRQVDDSKQSKVGSVLRDEESNTWLTPP